MRSFIMSLFLILTLSSCTTEKKHQADNATLHSNNYRNVQITSPGSYNIDDIFVINVKKTETSIASYIVLKQGQLIISSSERASLAQRWFLFWDDRDWLWVFSSDIGNFVWMPEKINDKSYKQYKLHDHPELLENLPNSIKNEFYY